MLAQMIPGPQLRRLVTLLVVWAFAHVCQATELRALKVLYVGNLKAARAGEYRAFLNGKVARIELAERVGFDPATAKAFDVVLLEWPQSESQSEFPPKKSPLGKLGDWVKPTVFLGSAGLHMATVWDVKGGFG
jgi:hypothetical protein